MIRLHKIHLLTISLIIGTLIYLIASMWEPSDKTLFQIINSEQPYGFKPVDCWFILEPELPRTECYYMNVPEDHSQQANQTRVIEYPVVVFRSSDSLHNKAPVLHLGAGGPGAAMGLDSTDNVKGIWEYHNDMSTHQGRDLFVIDPRGTGLSTSQNTIAFQ